MKKSLKKKLILVIMIVVTLIISLYIIFNIIYEYYIIKKEQRISLVNITNRLAYSLSISVFNHNIEQINNYLFAEMMNKNIYAIVIMDLIDKSLISGKIRNENWAVINYDISDNLNNNIKKKAFISRAGKQVGTVEVYFTFKYIKKSFFKTLVIRLLIIFFFSGIIIIVLSISISKIILKPINKLKNYVEIVSKGDLVTPINIVSDDEIGGLAKSFNIMHKTIIDKMKILDKKNKELNREIKEKKNTKETLKISEEKFKGLYLNMIEGVALHQTIYNKKGKPINYKIIDINPQYEKILNLKRKDIVNCLATEVYKTKEPAYLKELTDVGETGIPYYFETYFPPMDKHFAISVAPISKGQWATIFIDITERKKTEQALRESEERYKKLFEVSPEAIAISDENGIIINCNNPAVKIYGFNSKEEVIGKNVFEFIAPKDHEKVKGKLAELLEKSLISSSEYTFLKKNGESFNGELSAGLMKDLKGDTIGFVAIIKDITERKKTEQALIESEERYKKLFEVSPEAVTITDLDLIITNCNNITVRDFGYDLKEEIVGKNIFDLLASRDHELIKEKVLHMLVSNHPQNVEVTFFKKNGEEFAGELLGNIIKDINGEPVAIICISKDITSRKNFEKDRVIQEQKLMQVQKLNALGELSAGIAHEINQPLSGILMATDIIKIKLKEDIIDKEHLKEKMHNINDYINRIKKIIEHVRIFSRDQKDVNIEEFNINESITNALSLIKGQYKNHNININLKLSSSLPKLKGNVYQFEQIVLNLISNSKDALEEKEKIMNIKEFKKEIKLKTVYDNKNIFFEIYDNGMGISKENIKEIFNPFFTTKDTDKGTGLGLSISYGIIKEMKGSINVESEYKSYTIVKINFPKELNKNE